MDLFSLLYAMLILASVLVLVVLILYGARWITTKTNIKLYPVKEANFYVIDRFPLDSKRQLIRVQDKVHEYVILLGESDLLLDKVSIRNQE